MTPLPASTTALAQWIDHTHLAPVATASDIDKVCEEAVEHGFFSVCVQPCWVPRVARRLEGAQTLVCTVVGFPLGVNATVIKAREAHQAVSEGADELDMVMNLGSLLGGENDRVRDDVAAVVAAADGRRVKVILETARLDAKKISLACELALAGGAHFVKTSTGFGPGGATVEAVARMREAVGPEIGVKASGGIRDAAAARAMIRAGASRIGASASVAIVAGWMELISDA